MRYVFFHLIIMKCKSDDILSIIRIRSIKYWFMRVTIQILNTALSNLNTMNIRCHSLVFQMEVCVTNVNSTHKSNVMYPAKSMKTFL